MEIHSSSLAFIPHEQNTKNKTANTLASDKSKNNQKSQKSPSLPPPERIQKSVKATGFKQLSDEINKQQNSPTNSRTASALNAYIKQDTQALKLQRSELISTIDLFA